MALVSLDWLGPEGCCREPGVAQPPFFLGPSPAGSQKPCICVVMCDKPKKIHDNCDKVVSTVNKGRNLAPCLPCRKWELD